MSIAVLDNYKAKLVVFIFAIFIWFFVITENEYEHDIDLPITPVNIQPGKVILEDIPKSARVKIKGNGKDLIALTVSRGARIELDVSDVDDRKTFALDPKHVILSRPIGSITTKEVLSPDSVTIVLDDFVSKMVPVYPKIKPIIAPGYTKVGDFRIKPDSVRVSGPQRLIAKIDALETEDRELMELQFDLKKVFRLKPLPFAKVSVSVKEVEIYLNIQKLLERRLNGLPVEVRNAPRNMKVTVVPSTLSLVLEGGGDLLTQVSRDDIVAYIDYARIKNYPGNEVPAVIDKPQGISYRDVKPKKFRLVFEKP